MRIEPTLLGREEYKQYARRLAKKHGLINRTEIKIEAAILECESKFENIRQVYKELSADAKNEGHKNSRSIPAANILVENFYIILSKMSEVKSVMNGSGIGFLPERISIIAERMVANSDCSIDKNKIMEFIQAYQEIVYLTSNELWWIGAMLKIMLINKISEISNSIYEIKIQRDLGDKYSDFRNAGKIISKDPRKDGALIEHFSYKMKNDREMYIKFKEDIDRKYISMDLNLDEFIKFENDRQNTVQVSLSNAICSLRELDGIDFQEMFEKLSYLEKILMDDPADIYSKMDRESKDYYRKSVVKKAAKEKVSEFFIAKKALEQAKLENEHIGKYIIKQNTEQNKEIMTYKTAITSVSAVSTFFLAMYAYTRGGRWGGLFAVLTALIIFPVVFDILTQIVQRSFMSILKPMTLPRMNFKEGIPKEYSTMIIIPTLLSSEKHVEELCVYLESLYAVNGGGNIYFAIVGDISDSDREFLETDEIISQKGRETIAALNEKYGEGIFHFYLRNREYNEKQDRWLGRERKRGAIIDFNNYLKEAYEKDSENFPKIKYIITLDADTQMTVDAVKKLVGTAAHPLNRPVVDWEKGYVKEGYGVYQTCISTDIESTRKSLFTKIFAGHGGMDTYAVRISDLYMDMCGEGIYTGKGLYDLDIFNPLLENSIPDNLVLSHDLLEGSYLRTGFINDMQMIDSYPAKYNSYAMRLHRWVRGDWQIIRWLFPTVRNRNGEKVGNPLNSVSKWKIFDNLRRSWNEPALFIMLFSGAFFLPGNINLWTLIALGAFFVLPVAGVMEMLINIFNHPQNKRYMTFSGVISGLQSLWIQKLINVIFLPYTASLMVGAVCKTLFRLAITKKKMLEWVTAADMESILKGNLTSYLYMMKSCIVSGILIFLSQNPGMYVIGTLWLTAPFVAWFISKPSKKEEKKKQISGEDMKDLKEDARRIWGFYEKFVLPLDNYLPPDNVQFDPVFNVAHRTSPTNIGFYLISVIAATDFEFITLEEAADRIENTLNTLDRMEKWNGHLYNWYDTKSLVPLRPHYVSTVDSGNLQGYLMTVSSSLYKFGDEYKVLADRCMKTAENMDFVPLYNKDRNLFSIGFNIEDGRLSGSHYDLLVSEARQTSFIALAGRAVPEKHWKHLGRRPVTVKGYIGLASWSGTSFEFLMPDLIMKSYESSLLNEAVLTSVLAQMNYVKARTRPWGISESGFYEFDSNLNYQYKAFGIPRLGLKKGLADEFVIAPYASLLALSLAPSEVVENLKIIKALGAYGECGYYEAIDYTKERIGKDKYRIVRSHMAHHLGMSFIAIHNFIFDDLMKERFHSIPFIKGAEYLLKERVPISGTPQNDAVIGDSRLRIKYSEKTDTENYTKKITGIPNVLRMPSWAVLSNGRYNLLINSLGIGFSTKFGKILARKNFDGNEYTGGFYCFIKNVDTEMYFSPTAVPDSELPVYENISLRIPDEYEFSVSGDIVSYKRRDEQIETVTYITIAPENDVEIRTTEIINHGENCLILEITGGMSFALASEADYLAHPVYNNLFITTEFIEEEDMVVASKKPKEEGKAYIYGFYSFSVNRNSKESEVLGDLIYEADGERTKLKRKIKIDPGATMKFNFIFGMSENKEELVLEADKYNDFSNASRAFELSKLKSRSAVEEFALDMLPFLFYNSSEKLLFEKEISKCNINRNDLWALGISLDNPVILSFIDSSHGEEWINKLIETVRFYENRGVLCDLVFVSEEPAGYMQPVYEMISRLNIGNRAHIIRGSELEENLKNGLITFAAVIFNNEIFDLRRFDRIREFTPEKYKSNAEYSVMAVSDEKTDLSVYGQGYFDNGTGFFIKEPMEYLVYGNTPAPWINVIASPAFGFTADSSAQGCTWADNSRENRFTPWHNDIFHRNINENIYIENTSTGEIIGLMDGKISVVTRHGMGYSIFDYYLKGLKISLKMTCDFEKPVKIMNIKINNLTVDDIEFKIYYMVNPVIGVSSIKTFRHLKYEKITSENGLTQCTMVRNILPENLYGSHENKMFFTSEKTISVKGMKNGEVTMLMGKTGNTEEAVEMCGREKYSAQWDSERYFSRLLSKVNTSFEKFGNINKDAFELMFKGRLIYQTMSCRMFGRTAFYQSGGAYGYRDQLQDSLSMIPYDSDITKNQICMCCRHQFIEGDVQHWWHEPDGKGIRSRYSDDLLWLPYVVSEYLDGTKDMSVLTVCEYFIESPALDENEKERYELPVISSRKGTVYIHCTAAIKRALRFGKHGLPLMGGGDWNDGMNKVGNNESGESVWLAWFLLCILNRFIEIAHYMGDKENAELFTDEAAKLLKNIDEQAYDGSWYKRAFFHSGEPLGSAVNSECYIDSISQSWGAITIDEILIKDRQRSDNKLLSEDMRGRYTDHLVKAMDSVEKYLVDYKTGVMKLLTPPFVKSQPNPGYIMGYVAGVRENGGQYTHAAVWYVKGLMCMAQLMPEKKDYYIEKAFNILNLLNPLNHARTPLEVSIYRVEPYVVAADVYADPEGKIAGRGGWTWYTGAAGWMQKIAEDLSRM